MLEWFFRSSLPSAKEILCLWDTWHWLYSHVSGPGAMISARLLRPTGKSFPCVETHLPCDVSSLFDTARDHASMRDWPCTLEVCLPIGPPEHISALRSVYTHCPSFYRDAMAPPVLSVTRHPDSRWQDLVYEIAHGLGHYRTSGLPRPVRAPANSDERTADLCAIAMGFGLFVVDHLRASEGHQGLSRIEAIYCLAIFCALQDHSLVDGLHSEDQRSFQRCLKHVHSRHVYQLDQLKRTCQLTFLQAMTG